MKFLDLNSDELQGIYTAVVKKFSVKPDGDTWVDVPNQLFPQREKEMIQALYQAFGLEYANDDSIVVLKIRGDLPLGDPNRVRGYGPSFCLTPDREPAIRWGKHLIHLPVAPALSGRGLRVGHPNDSLLFEFETRYLGSYKDPVLLVFDGDSDVGTHCSVRPADYNDPPVAAEINLALAKGEVERAFAKVAVISPQLRENTLSLKDLTENAVYRAVSARQVQTRYGLNFVVQVEPVTGQRSDDPAPCPVWADRSLRQALQAKVELPCEFMISSYYQETKGRSVYFADLLSPRYQSLEGVDLSFLDV